MTKNDEQLLMQQLSDPKTQRVAFERLVREYSEPLYWQVRRMVLNHDDADDIMQNVFLEQNTVRKISSRSSKPETLMMRV